MESLPTQVQDMIKKNAPWALAIVAVIGCGAAGYFWLKLSGLEKNPQPAGQDEVAAVVKSVGEIMVLPEGEQPTVATVTDPERLKDQAFFAHAKIGDRVLIYTNARKAILYDPNQRKIIEVAPLNIGNQ